MSAPTSSSSARGVHIGSRWTPGPIERRDTSTGFFEAVNSHAHSQTDILVQRALLRPLRAKQVAAIEQARNAQRVGGATR
jgi:hypothetical protein